jgi:TatD DNase family protein
VPFVDSHAHLADPAFDDDRERVIERARDAGAAAIVSIGESLGAAERAERIATMHPRFVFWTAGVHPHDASAFDPTRDLDGIRAHVTRGAVAIGECGLDYHYDNAPRDTQRRVFAEQLQLSRELSRPVVVHTREAEDDTGAMMEDAARDGVVGVLHCFTGPASLAERAIACGWYLSISGVITFRKWNDDALLRAIPKDRLLVETDAPYLAPVPFRGKRNEPGYLPLVIERLAVARAEDAAALGAETVRNAARFFGLAVNAAGS